jgi:chromate transport protein ChrA
VSLEQAKVVGDALSVGAVVATLTGMLPAIAALVSIVWGLIRIYETETVQRWLK